METKPMIELHAKAEQLDQSDPLSIHRAKFSLPKDVIYLDGNSLGPPSKTALAMLEESARTQWAADLIKSWNSHDWISLPQRVGASIAPLIGANAEQVIACDSISVNLFKILSAIIRGSDRTTILLQEDNFPTDNYVAQGLGQFTQGKVRLRYAPPDQLTQALDDDVAALLLSHVHYRTGERYDLEAIAKFAHASGAKIIADLAHSAGVLDLRLNDWDVDFAVGCGYKFLNGGPGAPGFVFAKASAEAAATSALQGWMGHDSPFEFKAEQKTASGMKGFLVGTPPILSMSALMGALSDFEGIPLIELESKALALGHTFLTALDQLELLEALPLLSPIVQEKRGAQLSFSHPDAYAISQALISEGVIGDFRAPNVLRFGFSPLFLSFADTVNAALKLKEIMDNQIYTQKRFETKNKVT
jgi:kynureninase